MNQPAYAAKRVNDEYVVVRVDDVAKVERWVSGAAGFILLKHGIRGRGTIAAISTLAGAALAYYGCTGQSAVDLVQRQFCSRGDDARKSPSFPKSNVAKSGQVPEDSVEEAQMESFPASDPPASHHSS